MQRRYKKIINLSFVQVERPEGTIVDLESRARKLKVLSKLIASNNNNNNNSKKAKGSVKEVSNNNVDNLQNTQVSVNSATTGVYKCYAGGNLVHSFHVTMEREARL